MVGMHYCERYGDVRVVILALTRAQNIRVRGVTGQALRKTEAGKNTLRGRKDSSVIRVAKSK